MDGVHGALEGTIDGLLRVDRADALANPQSQIELEIDEHEYRYTLGRIWDDHIHIMSARDEESLATRTRGSDQWNVLLTRSRDAVVLIDRGQSIEINGATAMMPALASLLPEGDPLQIHLRRVLKALGSVRYYLGYGI